uniref:Uncharacterized protein n=1 Tax=Panagrolaimus sp. ES5 TaxID=591445 RepID=A0AC34FS55_9BILA
MLSRTLGNVSALAFKTEMAQNLRKKIDGPNVTESAEETYEQAKDKAQDLKKSAESFKNSVRDGKSGPVWFLFINLFTII